MFIQYFLGYNSFTIESIISPTLFFEIRKRLNQTIVNGISENVVVQQKEIEYKNAIKETKNRWLKLSKPTAT